MTVDGGNLFAGIADAHPPGALATERFSALLTTPHVRIERIVSLDHSSPPGFWYDQDKPEWVMVLAGAAAVRFENESAPRTLKRGDYLHIPAHARHRVEWTDQDEPTIWIAVHYG